MRSMCQVSQFSSGSLRVPHQFPIRFRTSQNYLLSVRASTEEAGPKPMAPDTPPSSSGGSQEASSSQKRSTQSTTSVEDDSFSWQEFFSRYH